MPGAAAHAPAVSFIALSVFIAWLSQWLDPWLRYGGAAVGTSFLCQPQAICINRWYCLGFFSWVGRLRRDAFDQAVNRAAVHTEGLRNHLGGLSFLEQTAGKRTLLRGELARPAQVYAA